jgi:hypothetical protein
VESHIFSQGLSGKKFSGMSENSIRKTSIMGLSVSAFSIER